MLHKSEDLAPSFLNNRMKTPQSSRIAPLFLKKPLSFWGMMITEYFSILLRKFKKKSLLQTNLKQPNQTTKVKTPPFFIATLIQTTSFLLK
ncbi:hypothetical protein HMPREF1402_01211 [Helicobacter pylori GAM121Aii]|nr:hypothetical protein HMPREF1402_01211 [Helicobacter pylori GAM121Aii]